MLLKVSLGYYASKHDIYQLIASYEERMTRNITQATQHLLWARAAGHCEICGRDVTRDLVMGNALNAAQVAHIKADGKLGPRYDPSQSEEDRNSIDNLMLLCHTCHKLIDDHPEEHTVEKLQQRKEQYETSVKRAIDSLKPHAANIVIMTAPLGGDSMEITKQECHEALSNCGLTVKNTKPFNIVIQDGADDLNNAVKIVNKRLARYKETVRDESIDYTAIFAIAPQPILIGMGLQLGDDGTINVFQRNREGAGWSWNDKAKPNRFEFDDTELSTSDAEDAVLILSICGEINEKSIPTILNDSSIPRLRLRASRQGLTSISREDDWFAFKEQAALASFKIHESCPNVKRVHVFPAMPTSANIAFGMAWNTRLIPGLVVYEKTNGKFYEAIRFGDKNGIY